MADQPGTLETVAEELGLALSSLEGVLTPQNMAALFVELGLDAAPDLTGDADFAQALEIASQRAGALLSTVGAISQARETNNSLAALEAVHQLLKAIAGLVTGLDQLSAEVVRATATLPEASDVKSFALNFVERVLGEAVISYLETAHPFLRRILSLLSVIEVSTTTVTVEEVPITFARKRLHLIRLSQLLRDPFAVFHDAYGWGDDGFDGKALFGNVRDVFDTLIPIATTHDANEDGPADVDLFGFLVRVAADAKPPGLQGILFADPTGQNDQTIGRLTENSQIVLQIEGGLTDGLALRLFPPAKLSARAGRNIAGRVALMILGEAAEPNDSFVILGESGGTRLQAAKVSAGLVADLEYDVVTDKTKSDFRLEAECTDGLLIIDPSGFDGFLASVLPSDGIRAPFEAGLVLSSGRGLTFNGSGGLDATFSVGLSLGPVTVRTVHVSLHANDSGLTAEVSASVALMIGPVNAVIDRVGLASKLTFPKTGGNLGVADLDLRFKPPTGIGLSIDASMVVGGGFISFDPEKGEYSGVLQLEIADRISVKAIGILTTRMPGGARGYSFVALIFAQGFAIQLGLGFALTGIGGLLAINRTFDEDALRGGLKNHLLDGVMFPKDPIRNAPEIISNLNKVFPPANGHHLFGPMLQISWGTPALITANLAVIVEFGARARLLILAQIAAILPKRENDLIRLQMDAIGVLDFDQGRASLDATLHDSRLLKKFVLTGDMAMRLKWKGSPNFALSVGGLHPAFNPPPAFPKLERIAINLSSGDNPRFRLEAYFALTSNSVQFGARAELYIEAAGFSLHGEIGFDVLIQFAPFFFQAGFYAQLQLKRGSTNLLKIRVEGSFAGPRPLHIKAKATFEILWWDVSISVDKTLVEGEKPPPPEPIEVLPRLKEALDNSGNWTSQLPDGQRQVVTLRAKTGGPTDVLLHPLGTLVVKQNVVPLDLDISRFGQATPAGARRFSIRGTVGGQTQTTIKDFFAPAEFLEMTDDEKLSRPSFEQMSAGVRFASSDFTFTTDTNDWLEAGAIEFETSILDENKKLRSSKTVYKLGNDRLVEQARFGAAGLSELRRTGKNKYRTSRVAHTLPKEGWSIVATDDLTTQPVAGIAAGQATNYSQAAEALRNLKRVDPASAASLTILRLSELSQN